MAQPRTRSTYRHGHLRAAAIEAAAAIVSESGFEALSLRRVAARVGTTHRSLYNHFADREALVDAVAEQGFTDLAADLKGAATPEAYVAAYAGYALKHPHLYALMKSRPHATMKLKPALQKAVHLSIAEAMRLFGRPERTSAGNRRAVMKVIYLLHGGIAMHTAGVLDVDGDAGLIAELQAMIGAP